MNQKYSFSELIKTDSSWLMTKLFYPSARLIRRPFYQRGGGYRGGKGLTTGRFCRFDLKGKDTLKIGTDCEFGDFTHIVAHKDVRIGNGVLAADRSLTGSICQMPAYMCTLRILKDGYPAS